MMQFEKSPEDGPGVLRVVFQEELADQFVFLGCLPVGLYTIRSDPGTPLNWLLSTARGISGRVIATGTPLFVAVLQAAGVIN